MSRPSNKPPRGHLLEVINPYELPPGYFTEDPLAGMPEHLEHHPPFYDQHTKTWYDNITPTQWSHRFELWEVHGYWRGGLGFPRGKLTRVEAQPNVDRALLKQYMEVGSASVRQMDVYLLVVEQGLSIRKTAIQLGMQRKDVRIHLTLLQKKAEQWLITGRSG